MRLNASEFKMTEQTPFQKQFKVNDEFYSGQQIRDAIKKHFKFEKHHNGDRYSSIIYSSSLGRGLWAVGEGLEGLIPDSEETEFKFHKINKIPIPNYKGYSVIIDVTEPDYEHCRPATRFGLTDSGYICIAQLHPERGVYNFKETFLNEF